MKLVGLFIVGAVCGALTVSAGPPPAFTNVSSVLDGAGDRSSGGTFSNISAVAQSGGVSVSSLAKSSNSTIRKASAKPTPGAALVETFEEIEDLLPARS